MSKKAKIPWSRKLCLKDEIFKDTAKWDCSINHNAASYNEFKHIFEKNSLKSLNFENDKK